MHGNGHAAGSAPIRCLVSALLFCTLAPAPRAGADPVVTAGTGLSCAGTRAGKYLGCSAQDFTTNVVLTNSTAASCTAGDDFYLDARVTMISSGPNRYNIGFFTGESENDPQANDPAATCSVATFPTSPYPWFRASTANTCGDFYATSISTPLVEQIRVQCSPDTSGRLQVPYAVTWEQNDNGYCSGAANVSPGTQSKCIGGTATVSNVVVKPRPAAWYRFDETQWNPTTGAVADSGDYGLDGTARDDAYTSGNGPAIGGNPGTCRYGVFDGDHDEVRIPSDARLIGTNALTYTAWINPRFELFDFGRQVVIAKSFTDGGDGRAQMGLYIQSNLLGISLKGRAMALNGHAESGWEVESPFYYFGIWTHVALVFSGTQLTLYVQGNPVATRSFAATTLRSNNDPLTIGNDYGKSDYFQGYIDEARVYTSALNSEQVTAVMNETHPCPVIAAMDSLRIEHDGSAIACHPESITLRACGNSSCSSLYTGGTRGTLTAGGNAVEFTIPAGQSGTVVNLHLPTDGSLPDPQSVVLGATNLSPAPANGVYCRNTSIDLLDNASACKSAVYKAGFLFDVPTLSSGRDSGPIGVTAVRSSNSNACVPLFQNVTRNVAFWGSYSDPADGTQSLLVNNAAVETTTSPSFGSTRSLAFDAEGKASLSSVRYDDVGLMRLAARYAGHAANVPPDGGMVVLGSDTFVVKPDRFELSAIRCTTADASHCGAGALAMSPSGANPAAADAAGGAFIPAGHPFSVTVTAKNAFGNATKNYGREATAEGVRLTPALVGGLGLTRNPPLTHDTGFGPFENGTATGTAFTWGEVGILTLTPSIGDGDYLGGGNVTGSTSGNVGRFFPGNFLLAMTQAPACGSFTYAGHADAASTKRGQPFTLSGTLTARNTANLTTENYAGAFARLTVDNVSATPLVGGAASGQITWPAATGSLDFTSGVGAFSKTDLRYAFDAEAPPAEMYLRVSANDADGATGTEADNTKTVEYRFGRIHLFNANGSELLPLTVPVRTEYFQDDGAGGGYYGVNAQDGCTAPLLAGDMQLRSPETSGGAWQSGDTTMTVGSGTTAAALGAMGGGKLPFSFTAPRAAGHVEIRTQFTVRFPWLLHDWSGDGHFSEEASGRASFGLYKGSPRHIYLRELY